MMVALPMRMFRSISLLLICSVFAVSAQNGLFRGRVVNASRDSIGLSGQEVQLFLFNQTFPEPKLINSGRSTANGHFQIAINQIDSAAQYLAATDHDGVRYYSEPMPIKSGMVIQDIVVYDSTHSAQTVRGLMHHVFVQNAGRSLAVRESRILENYSNKTIVSAINDEHEREAIFRIVLPAGAQNITPISARGEELSVHGHLLYDTGVFEPGRRQISFAYEIPWQKDRAPIEVDVPFATRAFDVFIGDEKMTLKGEGLVDHGPFNIRGVSYRRYGLQDVAAGKRIQLQFLRSAATTDTANPKRLLLITAGVLLVGVLFASLWRHKSTPVLTEAERQRLIKNRKRLIEEIAMLELTSETDIHSLQRRQELFEELQKIEWTLQQGRVGAKTGKP